MKHRLSAALLTNLLFLNLLPPAVCAYTDVPENHWASSYIEYAGQKGWVNGAETNFTPRRTLSGTELLDTLTNALLSGDEQSRVGTARLTEGTAAGDALSSPVSRYDTAQILINLLDGRQLPDPAQAPAFRDWDSIPERYRSAVEFCSRQGIFVGKDGCFSGNDALTRAELTALLYRTENLLTGFGNINTSCFMGAIPASAPGSDIYDFAVPLAPLPDLQQDTVLADAIQRTNAGRVNAGLSPLVVDDMLCAAAQVRALEIQQSFSHTRPDGSACFTVLNDEAKRGATQMGENILTGSDSPAKVVQVWMNSSGHRENILNKDFTHIGMARSGGGWVQIFIGLPE